MKRSLCLAGRYGLGWPLILIAGVCALVVISFQFVGGIVYQIADNFDGDCR